jgi:hypothetical protein
MKAMPCNYNLSIPMRFLWPHHLKNQASGSLGSKVLLQAPALSTVSWHMRVHNAFPLPCSLSWPAGRVLEYAALEVDSELVDCLGLSRRSTDVVAHGCWIAPVSQLLPQGSTMSWLAVALCIICTTPRRVLVRLEMWELYQ